MLHVLFASAQLWGSYNFYKMYKKQERIIAELEGRMDDMEAGSKIEDAKKDRTIITPVETAHLDGVSHYGSEIELTDQRSESR